MKNEQFNKIVEDQLEIIKSTLVSKNKEYSTGDDRLSNFREGSEADGISMEQVLWGYYRKHWLSVRKIVREGDEYKYPTLELLNEKITDSIIYHILLKAIMIEHIENENTKAL